MYLQRERQRPEFLEKKNLNDSPVNATLKNHDFPLMHSLLYLNITLKDLKDIEIIYVMYPITEQEEIVDKKPEDKKLMRFSL